MPYLIFPRHFLDQLKPYLRKRKMMACLHGRRKILVTGRPEKAEQYFVRYTCRNFGPCGAQEEKDLEGIKSGERKRKNGRPFFPGLTLGQNMLTWFNEPEFLFVKPGLSDFSICAKRLVNQGIPGKPGYSKTKRH